MCGRFTLFSSIEQIQESFNAYNLNELDLKTRYNIAPSQNVLTIVSDGQHNKAGFLKWGLIPSWAKDSKIGYKMINARAETVDEKPSYKGLLKRRRCLIVADGFYEWKNENGKKQPYRIKMKDDRVFAFAGLWDRWENENNVIHSCAIITTDANEVVKDIHDRMPVIIPKEEQEVWLDKSIEDPYILKQLLKPYPPEEMTTYQVSTLVN